MTTETPRTDAFHARMEDEDNGAGWLKYARQLERELNAANSDLEYLRGVRAKLDDKINRGVPPLRRDA